MYLFFILMSLVSCGRELDGSRSSDGTLPPFGCPSVLVPSGNFQDPVDSKLIQALISQGYSLTKVIFTHDRLVLKSYDYRGEHGSIIRYMLVMEPTDGHLYIFPSRSELAKNSISLIGKGYCAFADEIRQTSCLSGNPLYTDRYESYTQCKIPVYKIWTIEDQVMPCKPSIIKLAIQRCDGDITFRFDITINERPQALCRSNSAPYLRRA